MTITYALLLCLAGVLVLSDSADAYWSRLGIRRRMWGGYGWAGYGVYSPYSYYSYPYNYGYYRRSAIESNSIVENKPRVGCFYSNQRSSLMCTSPEGSVECQSIGAFNQTLYSTFAIGMNSNGYVLYPGHQGGWLNSTTKCDDGHFYSYTLWNGEDNGNTLGFNIPNAGCYDRMMSLWSGLTSNSSTIMVGIDGEKQTKVDVFGMVMLV